VGTPDQRVCGNCGKLIEAGVPFCGFCGLPVPAAPAPGAPAPAAPAQAAPAPPRRTERAARDSKSRAVITVFAVLVLVLIGVGVAVAYPRSGTHGTGATAGLPGRQPSAPPAIAGTRAAPWRSQAYPSSSGMSTGHMFSISCADSTHCWIVGATGAVNGSESAVILASTDGGATWSPQSFPSSTGLSANGHLYSDACPTVTACWAVGTAGSTLVILSTTDGGATWVSDSYPPGLAGAHLFSVTCPTVDACWATGATAAGTPIILSTAHNGSSWSEQSYPPDAAISNNGLFSISCPTASACWAIGESAGALVILTTSDGGSTWSTEPYASSSTLTRAYGNSLSSIDCPSSSTCMIVGFSGGKAAGSPPATLSTSDGGSTWTARTYPPELGLSSGQVIDLSCPDDANCWAIGERDTSPVILETTDGGSDWTSQAYPRTLGFSALGISSIYCPSSTACWALGNGKGGAPVILAARPVRGKS